MDQARRKRRSNILILIAVFAMIGSFWVVFLPGTRVYRNYQSERRIKATLPSLRLPPGAKELSVKTFHEAGLTLAWGTYVTNSPFDDVQAHYKMEFVRRGFAYTGETMMSESQASVLHFCASGYGADLQSTSPRISPLHGLAKGAKSVQLYAILIHERKTAC